MLKFKTIFSFVFFLFFQTVIYCQQTIKIGDKNTIDLTPEGKHFILQIESEKIIDKKILGISTSPRNFAEPAFIYIACDGTDPSPDNRKYSSQELGLNIIYLNVRDFEGGSQIKIFIKSLVNSTVELSVFVDTAIHLDQFPEGFRHKYNLTFGNGSDSENVKIEFRKNYSKNTRVLFYGLGENYNYFWMDAGYTEGSDRERIKCGQIFENGYGFTFVIKENTFSSESSKIEIIGRINNDKPDRKAVQNMKIEVGYEIIDNVEEAGDEPRKINILEHVYGMAENETCYIVNNLVNKSTTMLINTFTQGVSFRIKDVNNSVNYKLNVYNNYFIRLPKEFFIEGNYFCLSYVLPIDSDEEKTYPNLKTSYDFQIYYEDELANNQMFIMPLIVGKIYTHSLNRGDIMVYRNNFYGAYTEDNDKKIYSANMLRLRGNPRLYGFSCDKYPDNCTINANDLKNQTKVEKIYPLNMYHINKRLNAEGNIEIDKNGETVSELRKQYMTIVSCESEDNDPNQGECKYTIEINNEREEIQLMPETIFATHLIGSINNFLIRLTNIDLFNITFIKIHFTVLTGNAELFIYKQSMKQNPIQKDNFTHIHRTEIITIEKEDLNDNFYITVKNSEPSFIQIKYETNINYKGYNNLMPNEINIEPINKYTKTYYNMFNPNYRYPFNENTKNNDFYYKISTIDCSMTCSDVNQNFKDKTEFEFRHEKNRLYNYLSSYGFIGQVDESFHTSSGNEDCGIIIQNGEIAEDKPLLITSDMALKATFEYTYYEFPFVYDRNNELGIVIEFNLYDTDDSPEDDLFKVTIKTNMDDKKNEVSYNIASNQAINIDKTFYFPDGEEKNILGNLYITIQKKYPQRKYYITTNIRSSKISPEYINKKRHQFYLRANDTKYFYSQISKDEKGFLRLKEVPQEVKVYAKIVKKNNIEENYNWNGRVKLPVSGDANLISPVNGFLKYDQTQTGQCNEGCEIYFLFESKSTQEKLIPVSFSFLEGEYTDEKHFEEELELEQNEMIYYQIEINDANLNAAGDFIVIDTIPEKYSAPGYIYVSNQKNPSNENYDLLSQKPGPNQIYLTESYLNNKNTIYLAIKASAKTKLKIKVSTGEEIALENYPNVRYTAKLSDTNIISFTKKDGQTKKKILFYSIGENYNYYNMKVEFRKNEGNTNFDVKQTFENGFGAVVDFGSNIFEGIANPKIYIVLNTNEDSLKNRKVEVGYEYIDNVNELGDEPREINIFEHIYGMATNETCYKVKDLVKKPATMLINTFTQGASFRIKNENNSVNYTLDIFNNYFIRLPPEFYIEDNYFCFKHTTPFESEEEIFEEISYDFQIYYDDELANKQMLIMPLISGKIYTHSLNRGDIIIYRNNYYGDYTKGNETKIYSANMQRIRGNPRLYGFTCENYPTNCNINANDLKDKTKVEKINPLNMYYINKRLNAEGNIRIDENYAVSDLKKQYMTIVSCESEENDPNNGECKYTIEINNERDEIQLIPEIVFATSIMPVSNFFSIKLKDKELLNITSVKIDFTVLSGNAQLYIFDDFNCSNEFKDYKIKYIHRKEVIEINDNLKENFYFIVNCSEPAFIQLKYQTNLHYKGYYELMPNEVNIEPINKFVRTYYNIHNPNYYWPLNNEEKNKDVYYQLETMDCSMYVGDVGFNLTNIKELYMEQEKNKLYSYLTSYGFIGQIDQFSYTSSNDYACGIVIYNGEKGESRPLLITSDMPHKSILEQTYYVFPLIFDNDTDQGILIEFNLYNTKDVSGDLYEINCEIAGKSLFNENIKGNIIKYINRSSYEELFDENIIGNVLIGLRKLQPDKKNYYITTNIISSKISPEYLRDIKKYQFKLRPSSSKYFYSSISKDAECYMKFDNLPNNVKVYAKIVEKGKKEENCNWNNRVKLPDAGDSNLLELKDNSIDFKKDKTSKCSSGCEVYFHIKSEGEKKLNIEEKDLISISFDFSNDYKDNNDDGSNNVWIIIVVVVVVLIIAVVILLMILRKKKRILSSDIDMKENSELTMPLE